MLDHSHVRIPPDSTGKRMLHSMYMIIHYQYADELPGFGELVLGSISGASATIVYVDPNNTLQNGYIGVMSDKFSDTVFANGDTIISHGANVGTVVGCNAFYQPYTHIAGGNDTVNLVQVDNKGSMYTRFAEGEPQMDSFANLKVSDSVLLGEYAFPYNVINYRWHITEENGGAVSYQDQIKGMLLQNNTTINAKTAMTTHQYHHYTPGKGQTIQCTVACGDNGKENVIRRWGYYDDYDGIYFELNQNTVYACIRSSVSGTVVEKRVPRSNWNRDRLTGMGGHYNYSRHAIDCSKNTIYEFDFQWLGAGTVRFFVNVNGTRVPCHEEHNSGRYAVPYMRTGSLPFRVEQINTNATASTSEMRFYSAAVVTDGDFTPFHAKYGIENSFSRTISGPTSVPHASFRLSEMLHGLENRGIAIINDVTIYSSTEPITVSMVMNAELTGALWQKAHVCPDSMVEIDKDATAFAGGRLINTLILHPGESHIIDTREIFNTIGEFALRRKYDITEYFSLTMTVKSLNGNPTDVYACANWEEVL